MAQQHIFFQQFGINQGIQIPINPTYQYNTMILELANNWAFVRWLLCRFKDNMLKDVDPLEKEWLEFVTSNNLNIEKYEKDSNLFIEENLKAYTS
jgi:hypothetical protein